MAWDRPFASGAALAVCLFLCGCGPSQPPAAKDEPAQTDSAASQPPSRAGDEKAAADAAFPQRLPVERLPNAIRLNDKVISGGLPEGEAAFAELEQLGVKTVISVDGAKPDVGLARRHGMRYVHLPHGYDGVPESRVKELAKAVRDLDGPIYIHCHHGKHRSPAAAVVACIGAGLMPAGDGSETLKFAGTSENYKGLYESAAEAKRLEDQLLDELQADFPETAELPPLAKAMVDVEHTHDHLKQIAAAGWRMPPEHPDLDPAHEALLLREHFTELLRAAQDQQHPKDFLQMLEASEAAGAELETALRQWQDAGNPEPSPPQATKAFDLITKTCKKCHEVFRDVPLSKKNRDTQ